MRTLVFFSWIKTRSRSGRRSLIDFRAIIYDSLLLWSNALRRSEVTQCQVKHFEHREKRL